MTSLTRVQAA